MQFTSAITVPQDRAIVRDFLSNPNNSSKWDKSIKEVVLPPTGFTGQGCKVETVAPNGLRQSFIVSDFEPPSFFKFKLLSSSVFEEADLSFLLEVVEGGTLIVHTINIELRRSRFLLYPVLLLTQKKALARDMNYLKEALHRV